MAIDEDELQVLIHFDRWNSRFDEWLDMKSNRIRATRKTSTEASPQLAAARSTKLVRFGAASMKAPPTAGIWISNG